MHTTTTRTATFTDPATGRPLGGYALTRAHDGRITAAIFWGAVALLAAEHEARAAVECAQPGVIETTGEPCDA